MGRFGEDPLAFFGAIYGDTDEIDARFNAQSGWRVLDVRDAEFLNRVAQPTPAIAACIERL